MKYAIGIDIGGTKIASGIVNENGDIIQQEKVLSDLAGREEMFAGVVKCVNNLLDHSSIPLDDIAGIGVGVPGKVDVDKGIAVFQNDLPWKMFPLKKRVKAAFDVDRVTIDNDVYMATFAEWKKAQLTNDELFVYMTISTGISCAIIQSGEFLRGAGFAGEIGLVPVVQQGCGYLQDWSNSRELNVARLETVAAGPAMERAANKRYETTDITGFDLFAKFYEGENIAKELIQQMADAIAQSVYMLISIIDPHKIVFGGSVAFHNPYLIHLIKEQLHTHLIEEQKHILEQMDVSRMENDQGIIGAGLRVLDGR